MNVKYRTATDVNWLQREGGRGGRVDGLQSNIPI